MLVATVLDVSVLALSIDVAAVGIDFACPQKLERRRVHTHFDTDAFPCIKMMIMREIK
jgi:hypothetical protein